jgi:methylase of polypeptide subunit release factors
VTDTAQDARFSGSVAHLYERLLVPVIFEPYATDLAQRIARGAPASVLEIAAGTGVVARALARTLGPGCAVVATDLNQATRRSMRWPASSA